ncbi:MAG: hypothetical protein J6X45_01480, partial [Lachnospiraceae bacterium]|nr:hypothetical protein [Lachnospiraceae bacterium]
MNRFKKVISLLTVLSLTASTFAFAACDSRPSIDGPDPNAEIEEGTPAPDIEGYNLLWHDEFD